MFVLRAFNAWWPLWCLPNTPPGKEGRVSHLHQLMVNAPPALSPRSPEVLLSQLTDIKQIEGYQALL